MARLPWLMTSTLWACGFSATPAGGPGETVVTITHDSAADFAAGTLVDGVVSPRGVIEPDAFVLGGLHARGYAGQVVTAGDDFEAVLAKASETAATGEGYRQLPLDWAAERPRGLGLTASNGFTVLYDGEILLPAGTFVLESSSDDLGLVQVALDRETFGELLATTTSIGSITLTAPATGWYPIRAAISENNGNARLVLTLVDGQVRTPIGADRLRARVTTAPGLVVFAFGGLGFVTELGAVARPSVDERFAAAAPAFDLGLPIDRFSLRYAGQLRIDTAGSYTFTASVGPDVSDGWRLWLDGVPVAQRWGLDPEIASVTLDLAAGWHELLVDYADDVGNAEIALQMAGPDAPDGGPIEPGRLRPAVRFGNTASFLQPAATTIPDLETILVPLPVAGTPLTVIDAVDYGFGIENQNMAALAVDLFDCNGAKRLPLLPAPGYHYFAADRSCAGKPTTPASPWTLRLSDSMPGNPPFAGPGAIRDYGIAVLYHGGDRLPFAPLVSYESPPVATPGAVRLDRVEVTGSFEGAFVEVSVRTAADAAGLAAAPWEVVTDHVFPELDASEHLQYRFTISTNGWQFPELDRLEIGYVVVTDQD